MDPVATDDAAAADVDPPRAISPALAALFSFIWPGSGQWYAGRHARALVHALPPFAMLGVLLSLGVGGFEVLAGRLLTPVVALGVLAGIAALGVWRTLSILDAWLLAREPASARESASERESAPGPESASGAESASGPESAAGQDHAGGGDPGPTAARRGLRAVSVLVLVVITLGLHALPAWWAVAFYRAGTAIFQPPETAGPPAAVTEPTPSPDPAQTGPRPTPAATLTPTPEPDDGRLNVLLVGIDSSAYRPEEHRLTDTILLVSFDPAGGRIEMLSVPRDVARFPMYLGGIHEGKINELMREAESDPVRYPHGGMGTLVREVGFLLGTAIDDYASVDITGFQSLIDAVGGVDIMLSEPIDDPEYQFSNEQRGFFLPAGQHHLDGRTAVAYVRSRKGPGGGEARSLRQQQLLLALRERVEDPAIVTRLPEILEAVSATLRTDVPSGDLPRMLELARASGEADVEQFVLGPERYARIIPADEVDGQYALELRLARVADLSRRLWGEDSYYADAGYYERLVGVSDPGG